MLLESLLKDELVKISYVNTKDMLADMFTKPIARSLLESSAKIPFW